MIELRELIDQLSRPEAYAHPVERVEVVQTHVSVVFLAGDRAYKLKKPVDLGFLDFRSAETRRRVCEDEVRLNRRLAPDVYLGVVPIVRAGDGLRVGGLGPAVEWAVEMVRLPVERMLDRLIDEGAAGPDLIGELASLLARFHRAAATGPAVDEHGLPEAVAFNARENLEQTERFVSDRPGPGHTFRPALHALVRDSVERFLESEQALLSRRVAEGRIRDGHGDLHAGNVCVLPSGIVVYDCIEFAERFRCGDVASDLGFLAMDLDARGRRDLSERLVDGYVAESGDTELRLLVAFYKSYRAMVRAKVDSIAAVEAELPAQTREEKRREAIRYAALAGGYALPPSLVVICGLPGTGKTTVAASLAVALGAAHLRSDVVRKQLAGLGPTDRAAGRFGEGIYGPEATTRTYSAMLERAEAALRGGRPVVVDATFATSALREPFVLLAARLSSPLAVVEATAPPEVVAERLRRRARDPDEASDAGLDVYLAMRDWYEPPAELDHATVVRARSGVAVEEGLLEVVDALCRGVRSSA